MSRTTDQHRLTQMEKAEGQSEFIGVHQWFYSPDHGQLCQVIESQNALGRYDLPRLAARLGFGGAYSVNQHCRKAATYV